MVTLAGGDGGGGGGGGALRQATVRPVINHSREREREMMEDMTWRDMY